jgi:hypothetical protein
MLVDLLGELLNVQTHYVIYFLSDHEHDDDVWVVTFFLEDMGEVLS